MIFDAFPVFNEIEMVAARMAELKDIPHVVHVAVEAHTTFTGIEKPLYLAEWCEREGQPERLVLMGLDLPPTSNPWDAEKAQRAALIEVLRAMPVRPDDVVLSCDVDEIVRGEAASRIADACRQFGSVSLVMRHHVFDFGWYEPSGWWKAKAFLGSDLPADLSDARNTAFRQVQDAGWHLSWFGGYGRMECKLRSFSHTEYDTPGMHESLRRRVEEGEHLTGARLAPWLGGDFPATFSRP